MHAASVPLPSRDSSANKGAASGPTSRASRSETCICRQLLRETRTASVRERLMEDPGAKMGPHRPWPTTAPLTAMLLTRCIANATIQPQLDS